MAWWHAHCDLPEGGDDLLGDPQRDLGVNIRGVDLELPGVSCRVGR